MAQSPNGCGSTFLVQALAGYSDADWQFVLDRWDTIRQYHRQYIHY